MASAPAGAAELLDRAHRARDHEQPVLCQRRAPVEEEALQHGYKTIIFNHNGDESLERQGIERLLERRMDALLVCNATSAANVELALAGGVAVVQIERETSTPTMAVIADNYRGAREAMMHLIGLGHHRIAFVGGDPAHMPYHGPQAMSVEEQRLAAYREALVEAGIAVRPDYIRLGRYYDIPAGSGRYGREHTQALLELDERPTAIFATCDVLAAGVLQALHAARLRVPDEMSVIGFDDTLASNLAPALHVRRAADARNGCRSLPLGHGGAQWRRRAAYRDDADLGRSAGLDRRPGRDPIARRRPSMLSIELTNDLPARGFRPIP